MSSKWVLVEAEDALSEDEFVMINTLAESSDNGKKPTTSGIAHQKNPSKLPKPSTTTSKNKADKSSTPPIASIKDFPELQKSSESNATTAAITHEKLKPIRLHKFQHVMKYDCNNDLKVFHEKVLTELEGAHENLEFSREAEDGEKKNPCFLDLKKDIGNQIRSMWTDTEIWELAQALKIDYNALSDRDLQRQARLCVDRLYQKSLVAFPTH